MNRLTAALLAAFDAAIAALIGIGIVLVPLTLLWAVQYSTTLDGAIFWRAAVDVWLLGNGADLAATVPHETALVLESALGLTGATEPFVITLAPLGLALVAVLLGTRIGRRAAATEHRLVAIGTALGVYALIAFVVSLTAGVDGARVPVLQGVLWPTLVFAVGIAIGSGIASLRTATAHAPSAGGQGHGHGHASAADEPARPDAVARALAVVVDRIPEPLRVALSAAGAGGALAASIVVGASAVLLAVLLVVNYADAITLYESLQIDVLGGIALTIGQLAILPNLVLWTAGWLVGPGFAIGTGSSVGPAGTLLGPIPSVPVLAALPEGELAFGFIGVAVPLVAGFVGAWIIRRRLLDGLADAGIDGRALVAWAAGAIVGIGLVGGLVLGVLAALSGGSAGPGRLADVGPDALLVGAVAAAEFAVAGAIGLVSGRARDR